MNLSRPPRHFWAQWGGLPMGMREWVQPPDHWKLILYGHAGVARINGRLYSFNEGSGLVFPPYAVCGHNQHGEACPIAGVTFDIDPDAAQPHAIPVEFEQQSGWYADLFDATERATEGAIRAKALTWHILWSIAQPASALRDQSEMYEAEDLIREEIDQPLRVADIAKRLDVSQGTLLNWFQSEHGTTIQGFIRQTRAREACRLLASSHLRIKEIAVKVGVPDLQQFNKLVRGHSGLSPREYRNKSW